MIQCNKLLYMFILQCRVYVTKKNVNYLLHVVFPGLWWAPPPPTLCRLLCDTSSTSSSCSPVSPVSTAVVMMSGGAVLDLVLVERTTSTFKAASITLSFHVLLLSGHGGSKSVLILQWKSRKPSSKNWCGRLLSYLFRQICAWFLQTKGTTGTWLYWMSWHHWWCIKMDWFSEHFNPCWNGKPAIWQSWPICDVRSGERQGITQDGVSSFIRHCYGPHFASACVGVIRGHCRK